MIRSTRIGLVLVIATVAVIGSASLAQAQYQAPPPGYYAPPPRYGYGPPPRRYGFYREGLVVGAAIGGGGISASGCQPGYCGGAISGELHIGGMLNQRLALMFDLWGNARGIDGTDGTLSQSFWTAAFQFWPADIFWLKGGLGISHVQVSSDSIGVVDDETALGLVLGAGVEVVQVGNMALDLQFRFGHGFYDTPVNNYAFLVGLSWY
jgi:opacity protein-like surface antigen